jgi:tetratricopeptide (TPR) repeat protein
LEPAKAEKSAVKLVNEFPKNNLYKGIYVETLVTLNKVEQAKPIINEIGSSGSTYFSMMSEIYRRIVVEKQEKNLEQAKNHFINAIEISSSIPIKTDHYKSMAYCGLARISSLSGNNEAARDHYKKALSIANYSSVKKEAEDFLNKNKNF